MSHPVADEFRARDDSEITILAFHQVDQRVTIDFVQVQKTEQGPKLALGSRLHELIEIVQMTTKEVFRKRGSSRGERLGGRYRESSCFSFEAESFLRPTYLHLMLEEEFLAQRRRKEGVNPGNEQCWNKTTDGGKN